MNTGHVCITTDQGTGTPETCLCPKCFEDPANQSYARDCASNTDDIDPSGAFEDCGKNDALECCICGSLCARDITPPSLYDALHDCQEVMDAAANQISDGGYIDPAELKATANQLAEYAMRARSALACYPSTPEIVPPGRS